MTTSEQVSLWINGCDGKMGQAIRSSLDDERFLSFKYRGGSSLKTPLAQGDLNGCDLIIDFSTVEGNHDLLSYMSQNEDLGQLKYVLIGTTGLSRDMLEQWKKLAKDRSLSLLFAPNTSLGILMTLNSALLLAKISRNNDFDIEIEETHHRHKRDAPSGTAKFLADHLAKTSEDLHCIAQRSGKRSKNEIGIQVTRGGGVFGEHSIRFLSEFEEVKIEHRAFSRDLFAHGSLALSQWLKNQKPGVYGLLDVDLSQVY